MLHLAKSHVRSCDRAKVRSNHALAPFCSSWSTTGVTKSRLPIQISLRAWHRKKRKLSSDMSDIAEESVEELENEASGEVQDEILDEVDEDVVEKCKTLESEVEALERSIEELKSEMCELRCQLRSAQVTIESYCETIKQMENAANEQRSLTEIKIAALQKADGIIHDLQQQVEGEELEQRLLQARLTAVTMERDNHLYQLQKAVEKSDKDEKELRSKFEQDLSGLGKCNADREQQMMDDCEWKLREIERNYKLKLDCEKKVQQELLTTTVKKLEWQRAREQEQFQSEKESLIRDKNDIQSELTERIHCSESELRQLQGLTHELQRGSEIVQSRVEEMRETENELTEELACVNRQLDESRQIISKLKTEICEIKERHEKMLLRAEMHSARKVVQAKSETEDVFAEKLRKQASILQEQLFKEYEDDKQDALEALQAKKDLELTQIMQEFQYKQEDYRNQLDHLESENRELRNKCLNLNESLKKAEKDNEYLVNKLTFSQNQFRQQYLELRSKFAAIKSTDSNINVKNELSQLSNLRDLQNRLNDLIERQSASDCEIKTETRHNLNFEGDSEASARKVDIREELNHIRETLLKTVCVEVHKTQLAEQRENVLKKQVTELQDELKLLRNKVASLTENLSTPEKILFHIETSSPAQSSWLNHMLLLPIFVLCCSTIIAFAITFLLLSLLLPALLPYLPL